MTNLRKAIKTENSYYIFMEMCNGNDLKDLMDCKSWKLQPEVIHKIMCQLVQGVFDMMEVLVIHRDLKL